MNKLLTRAKTMINPPPERIRWCYKRWQPLFRSSMTIKLGYLVSINASSFRVSGKPCITRKFLIVLCISLNKGCHLL
jgi:hypothetical protein